MKTAKNILAILGIIAILWIGIGFILEYITTEPTEKVVPYSELDQVYDVQLSSMSGFSFVTGKVSSNREIIRFSLHSKYGWDNNDYKINYMQYSTIEGKNTLVIAAWNQAYGFESMITIAKSDDYLKSGCYDIIITDSRNDGSIANLRCTSFPNTKKD